MPETNSRQDKAITILETNYLFMTKQLEEIKTGINSINDKLTIATEESRREIARVKECYKKELEDHARDSASKYAEKRVEVLADRIMWLVLSTIVIAILSLIIVGKSYL